MLLLGQMRARTCQGMTRRALLQIGASSLLGLSLADLSRLRAAGSSVNGSARSVLFLWLWGGPAHLDTWDPKPDAPLEFRGPFSPIATSVTGMRIGELFPQIAKQAQRFAVVRSLHTASSDHGVAGTIGLTGSVGRRRRTGWQTEGRLGPAGAGQHRGQGVRRVVETAAVSGRRRPAASGQESHPRRGRRTARRPLRSVSPRIRSGQEGHAHPRSAIAGRPHARTARRSPTFGAGVR